MAAGFDPGQKLHVLTPADVRSILNIGKNQVYALMHSDAFPTTFLNNRLFVTEEDLRKWMETYAGRQYRF